MDDDDRARRVRADPEPDRAKVGGDGCRERDARRCGSNGRSRGKRHACRDACPEKWIELEASPGAAELAPGAEATQASQWAKARASLKLALSKIRPTGQLDETMAGGALLGRACVALKDTTCADEAFGAVLGQWKGAETVSAIEVGAGDDAAKRQRVQRALLAVGEALYFEAEKKRAAADKIMFPTYAGKGDKDSVSEFVAVKVAAWVKEKRLAIEAADAAFAKVPALADASRGILAPPHWVVAASSRTGEMKAKFAAQFRAAPIPNDWHRNGLVPDGSGRTYDDIRAAYYGALDTASEPLKLEAKAAFETCQTVSKQHGYADDFSRYCDTWLERNYPPSQVSK